MRHDQRLHVGIKLRIAGVQVERRAGHHAAALGGHHIDRALPHAPGVPVCTLAGVGVVGGVLAVDDFEQHAQTIGGGKEGFKVALRGPERAPGGY